MHIKNFRIWLRWIRKSDLTLSALKSSIFWLLTMNYLKGVWKTSLLMGKICISKEMTSTKLWSWFIVSIHRLRGPQLLTQGRVLLKSLFTQLSFLPPNMMQYSWLLSPPNSSWEDLWSQHSSGGLQNHDSSLHTGIHGQPASEFNSIYTLPSNGWFSPQRTAGIAACW